MFVIYSCQSDVCSFDGSFLTNQVQEELTLVIKQDGASCSDLHLEGQLNEEYKIDLPLIIQDSVYRSSNEILFDFSQQKQSGRIPLNINLDLEISFLMDVPFQHENYRLFKSSTIEKYYEIDLSYVWITHYHYGIVGEFVIGNENNEWFSSRYRGFIPNEQLIFSKFKKRGIFINQRNNWQLSKSLAPSLLIHRLMQLVQVVKSIPILFL